MPTMHDSPEGQTQHWTPEEQMRAEFEAEVLKTGGRIGRLPCGTYSDPAMESAWRAWQAFASQYSATIARLEAENAGLQKTCAYECELKDVFIEKLASAELSNRQRWDALIHHGRHDKNCEAITEGGDAVCTCGLSDALAQPLDMSALDAYVAKCVPTGYKVVPINMTDEMYEAYDQATQFGSIEDGWKAMLDAAPLPPSPDKKD